MIYEPDAELEQRAWQVAEQCLQHTREVLMAQADKADKGGEGEAKGGDGKAAEEEEGVPASARVHPGVLEPYRDVYRPKIYNSQRAEKSQLIEESRQLGLVPDFSEVAAKEELCRLCASHILRHHIVLEEHVRTHLPQPTYQCNIDACSVAHESKNFIARHMKEVHKYRRQPLDLLEEKAHLVAAFTDRCAAAFPDFFDADALRRIRFRYSGSNAASRKSSAGPQPSASAPTLVLPSNGLPSGSPRPAAATTAVAGRTCQLCQAEFGGGDFGQLLEHILSHVSRARFLCILCARSEPNQVRSFQPPSTVGPVKCGLLRALCWSTRRRPTLRIPRTRLYRKSSRPSPRQRQDLSIPSMWDLEDWNAFEVEALIKVCFPGSSLPQS